MKNSVANAQSIVVEPSNNNKNFVYQSMEGIYFQEEILMDILSRLPLRSLFRFRCVSKFWGTLIFNPNFKMKIKISDAEMVACTRNIVDYLFCLLVGLYKDREADWREFCDKHPLSKGVGKFLEYSSGSDVHPSDSSEDENSEESYTNDEDYDREEIDDVESSDESDNIVADAGDKGKLSAEGSPDCAYNRLCYFCCMVPTFEKLYEDRKADFKEIQGKHLLSRQARELIGYDPGSDMQPSLVGNITAKRLMVQSPAIERMLVMTQMKSLMIEVMMRLDDIREPFSPPLLYIWEWNDIAPFSV